MSLLIYKQTGNLRVVQILLGHTKIESTVRYLDVDVEDALTLAERTESDHGQPRLMLISAATDRSALGPAQKGGQQNGRFGASWM